MAQNMENIDFRTLFTVTSQQWSLPIQDNGSVEFFRNLPHQTITKLLIIYSVIHKRVFTPPRDLTTRIIEAIDQSSNSIMALIPERCENSFVNYKINYQKLS